MNGDALGISQISLQSLFRDEPLFTSAGLVILALIIPTLAAMMVDNRLVDGVNPWVKPLKFQLSLSLYLLTLALFAGFLPENMVASPVYRIYSVIVVVAIALELLWLGNAAMRAIPAHFNTDPFYNGVYQVMGFLAILLTSATLVYGIAILTHRTDPLALAIALSLILTFVLTLGAAMPLASGSGSLVGSPTNGDTVWLMGWSREVGDLRVAHFFATHAMQVIPVAALVVMMLLPPLFQIPAILGSCAAYIAFTVWTFSEASAGRPFI